MGRQSWVSLAADFGFLGAARFDFGCSWGDSAFVTNGGTDDCKKDVGFN